MSIETDKQFTEEMEAEISMVEEAERKARAIVIKETLKKTKPFKDFVMGREKEWEEIKDLIALHAFKLPCAGNEVITKDFIAGIRFALELVDGYVTQFDKAYEQLGGN